MVGCAPPPLAAREGARAPRPAGPGAHGCEVRFGELFPLPLPLRPQSFECHSRRSRQRTQRRNTLHGKEVDAISTLNELAGYCDRSQWPGASRNRAQEKATNHINNSILERPVDGHRPSPEAALRQLLHSGSNYEGPGRLAPYARGKVSLPADQGVAAELVDLLPKEFAGKLRNFSEAMLLSEEELGGVMQDTSMPGCYHDPVLANSPREWAGFVCELLRSGVIDFTLRPQVVAGVFFVRKKSGALRLIIDARRANRLVRAPPAGRNSSTECRTRVSLQEDQQLFIAQEDVKDCFYRMGISKALGEFFSLPVVSRELLLEELCLSGDGVYRTQVEAMPEEFFPHMRVLPMVSLGPFYLHKKPIVNLLLDPFLSLVFGRTFVLCPAWRLGGQAS